MSDSESNVNFKNDYEFNYKVRFYMIFRLLKTS